MSQKFDEEYLESEYDDEAFLREFEAAEEDMDELLCNTHNAIQELMTTPEGREKMISIVKDSPPFVLGWDIFHSIVSKLVNEYGVDVNRMGDLGKAILTGNEENINMHSGTRDYQNMYNEPIKSSGNELKAVRRSASTRANIGPNTNAPKAAEAAKKVALDSASDEVKELHEPAPGTVFGHYSPLQQVSASENIKFKDTAKDDAEDTALSAVKFSESIKILLINAVDWRIICHFLGVQSVTDVKSAPYSNVPMIGLLLMESAVRFFEANDYTFAGEIDFDSEGNPVPVKKQTWLIKKSEYSFTRQGYLFFEHKSGDRSKNIVCYNLSDFDKGVSGVTCFSVDSVFSKRVVTDLEKFAKTNNCIRGTKIRDVNMLSAKFEEVADVENFNWANSYYEPHIQDVFELEIFGFLNNIEEYNKLGLDKRGVMIHGEPGTGKTRFGKIVCNLSGDKTVIWITPDLIAENNANKHSVKLLYTLADFVSPAALILEDIDLWCNDRDDMGDTLRLGAIMNILDGVNSVKNTVTIAMTNRIELIEKALRNRPGRFDVIIEIPALNEELRKRMLTDRTTHMAVEDGVIDYVVRNTDGWTGAYVQHFLHSVNMYFIHNKIEEADRKLTLEVTKKVLKTINRYSFKGSVENGRGKAGFN